ncbi:hypothetical protein TrST_g10636 [Triparma strigata]|uniref:Lon N-terminal domain-containing protein n=2 Tax=Triparma TaxID=722752 RepID=A0A9W7EJD7_9STRA|nr:hypothetical protein TrST_g10636 [Triparma strigata]
MNSLLLLVLLPLSALSLTPPISYLPLQPVTINTNTKINIIPTFPLGSAVYTPGESVTLSIFEPRYRKMYDHILLNGSRRFIVPQTITDPTTGEKKVSEYAPVLYLDELKDVSGKTGDQVKYLCSHSCVGIARIAGVKRLSQPGQDEWMECYAEVLPEEVITVEDAVDLTAIRSHYKKLVDLQHTTTSSVRFTKDSVNTLALAPGREEGSLWSTVRLWSRFKDQYASNLEREIQESLQIKILDHLKELNQENTASINFESLPDNLKKEVLEVERRVREECAPIYEESNRFLQVCLQMSYGERVKEVCGRIEEEVRLGEGRVMLSNIIGGGGGNGGAEGGERKDEEGFQ